MKDIWQKTPAQLELSRKYIDVWRTSLDLPQQQIDSYRSLLHTEELARASRFKVDRKYREYIISRGLLRRILGLTLGLDPGAIAFTYSEHNKPDLDMCWHGMPVCFNVSHSHEMTLIAVTLDRLVGVDVEFVRHNVEFKKLAKRFFSVRETHDLDSYTDATLPPAFFSCWTRKEAFVKALGDGIAFGLKEFSVSVNPSDREVALTTHWDRDQAKNWSLLNIQAGPEYIAALAATGPGYEIRCWE